MKRTLRTGYLLFCAASCISLACGQSPVKRWSLTECIEYAIEHNIEIRQQQITVNESEIDLNTSRNSRLPSLSGSASQNFNFGRSPDPATGIYEANQTTSTSLGLSFSTPVFSGMRIHNQIAYNELNLKAAIEGLEKAKENLGLQVTSYYLDLLFKKELVKVARERIALTSDQVTKTASLVEAGKVPESQLYDIRSQLAQHEVSLTNAENDLGLSRLNLSQALNLPDHYNFDIREPEQSHLLDRNRATTFSPDDIFDIALGIKPHIREAEFRWEGSKRQVKIAESSLYPTVSLGMSYNTGYSHVFNSDRDIDPFITQFRHNRREAIGLSISVPVFNRFQTRNQVCSARLSMENRLLQLDNVKLSLYKEIQQAHQSAMAAEAKYRATDVALEAAQKAYSYAEERYNVGKSTVYEFNEVQTNLIYSQSEQIQAKYDYLFRAKILDFYRGEPLEIR